MTAKTEIFVSYSRQDAAIVDPLVRLLRVSAREVFRDVDSIPSGVKWRVSLADAIEQCGTFVLFWCIHSFTSTEVEKEYQQALDHGEALIVPVLLDNAPLPPVLSEYQGIDLRGVLGRHEVCVDTTPSGTDTDMDRGFQTISSGKKYRQRKPSSSEFTRGYVELKSQLAGIIGIR